MVSDDLIFRSTVTGDDALKQRFLDFNGTARAVMRRALASIGAMVRSAEQASAPKGKTGDLAGKTAENQKETDTSIVETIGPRVFYARFVVGGVVNHGTVNNKRAVKGNLRKMNVRRGLVETVRQLRSQGQWRMKPNDYIANTWASVQDAAQAQLDSALAEAAKGF